MGMAHFKMTHTDHAQLHSLDRERNLPRAGYMLWRNMLHDLQYTSAEKDISIPQNVLPHLWVTCSFALVFSRVHKNVIVIYQQVRVLLQNCKISHQIGK